jgi:FSR family fosmidomycin resistance protein-like MFS transporter
MSVETVVSTRKPDLAGSQFQAGRVLAISGSHFLHDTYSAFVSPLLPLIIEKLSLSLTLAGSLTIFPQLPSLLQPFIGYLADRTNLRYFVILAPAVTATLMSLIGLAPSYGLLVILLLVVGVSSASYHAPSPAVIGQLSGSRTGRGMSFYMIGGEMGRVVGPLLAVGAVSWWTLEGIYRLILPGLAASLLLYWRLRDVPIHIEKQGDGSLRQVWRVLRGPLSPLMGIILARSLLLGTLTTYLPTFLTLEGESLWLAGSSLSIYELAGVVGTFAGGTLSDRWGRKQVFWISMTSAPLFMLALPLAKGWLLFPTLLALGFTAISMAPVLLAVVQDHFPENRATANGLVLAFSFVSRSLIVVGVGLVGDYLGLRTAFIWSAALALLGVPFIFFLPEPATSIR